MTSSDHIFNRLKKGDQVDVVEARKLPWMRAGHAHWYLSPGRTAFAPIRSLIEHAMALEMFDGVRAGCDDSFC